MDSIICALCSAELWQWYNDDLIDAETLYLLLKANREDAPLPEAE